MKQISRILSIAALAIVGALACTELNKISSQAGNDEGAGNGTVTLTATVSLDETPGTRALDASGHKTFAGDDKIAIIYKNTSDQTKKVVSTILAENISSDGKHAKITVTLDNPKPAGALRLIYPAAMAGETIAEGAEINDDNTVDFAALNAQDGVLTTLASNYDLTIFEGNLTSDGQLPTPISLTNRLAILELTVKDFGGTAELDNLTGLTISDGTNSYTITPKSPATTLTWPVYVAVKPVTSEKTITVTAVSSPYPYTKSVTGQALAQSNIYPVTVKMHRIINLANLTTEFDALHGDILQGTLGSNVKISIADGAAVTLGGMAINGVNNTACKWAGLTCIGDATLIIADGTTNTVTGFEYHYPGIFIPAGKTLTIQGNTGSLTVATNIDGIYSGAAAIGVSYYSDAGNIEIQGGTINAYGGNYSYQQHRNCGSITISGGNITATAGAYAAGIGGGENSEAGDITIRGGTVNATGGPGAAGIGSGGSSNSGYISNCGNILITGTASVEAYGGTLAAAIGSGRMASCGSITISGSANVTAVANSGDGGAGIGSGCQTINKTCGDILISTSGTVVATGGLDGAGIGSGGSADGTNGKCGNITISAGTIIATGSNNAAGIGLAAGGRVCGDITITDGITSVSATKGNNNNHDCIGFGNEAQKQQGITLGTIKIDDKVITVNNTSAAPSYDPEGYSFEHLNSSLSTDSKTWTLTHK